MIVNKSLGRGGYTHIWLRWLSHICVETWAMRAGYYIRLELVERFDYSVLVRAGVSLWGVFVCRVVLWSIDPLPCHVAGFRWLPAACGGDVAVLSVCTRSCRFLTILYTQFVSWSRIPIYIVLW